MLLPSLLPKSASAEGPAAEPDRFVAWLRTLAPDTTGNAARALAAGIERLRAGTAAARRAMIAANDLLKTLGAAYSDIIAASPHHWLAPGRAQAARRVIVRTMEAHARRLQLGYRVYLRGSRSAWQELHRLYRIARERGDATRIPEAATRSPQAVYAEALLLALAEPTRFVPGELDRVRFYVARHAGLARLREVVDEDARPAPGVFVLKAGDDIAARRPAGSARISAALGDLILDCGPLLARLDTQLEELRRGTPPLKLGLPLAARRSDYLAMLESLRHAWSAQRGRRHARQQFKPRVDMVSGFDALWSFLSGPAFRRRFEDGRAARQAAALDIGEWAIANEGAGGFALQFVGGKAGAVQVGEIVGLRPPERALVHVCIVRRVDRK